MLNKADRFKGFEEFYNNLKMSAKMHFMIIVFIFTCALSVSFVITYFSNQSIVNKAINLLWLGIINFKFDIVKEIFGRLFVLFFKDILFTFVLICFVGIPAYLYAVRFFAKKAQQQKEDEYVSGAKLIDKKTLHNELSRLPVRIPFSEIKIPLKRETEHFLVVGETGSGKSQLLLQAMTFLQKTNSKVICLDADADYIQTHYNPERDLLFNPIDKRSIKYSIFNDVQNILEVDQVLCHSFIPNRAGRDPFWSNAARAVLRGILYWVYYKNNGKVTNRAVWEVLSEGAENISLKLQEIPEGKIGFSMITDAHSKQTQGVMAMLLQYVGVLEVMASQDGNFSIRKWLHDEKPGTLFLVNHSSSKDIVKPILTLLIDTAANEIISNMPADLNRRIFIFLDEFGSINPLHSIVDLLTKGRKKGASCWLGMQNIAQIDDLYGQEKRQAIVQNCVTKAILKLGEKDTAEYLSGLIGDVEIRQASESIMMGPDSGRDGITINKPNKVKRLFLPSDLQGLDKDNLEGIFNINSKYLKMNVPLTRYKYINENFLVRDELLLINLLEKQKIRGLKLDTIGNEPGPASKASEKEVGEFIY